MLLMHTGVFSYMQMLAPRGSRAPHFLLQRMRRKAIFSMVFKFAVNDFLDDREFKNLSKVTLVGYRLTLNKFRCRDSCRGASRPKAPT